MKTSFIFDFDNTIINDNSDTFVPEFLQSSRGTARIQDWLNLPAEERTFGWTKLMDNVVEILQTERPDTFLQDVNRAAANYPHDADMLQVLRLAAELGDLHIVSDANEMYIRAFLDQHAIAPKSIQTNAFVKSGDRYQVLPYHDRHDCDMCPSNMCKGEIVQRIVETFSPPARATRIIYFGDGSNDYCPVVKAMRGDADIVFARDDLENAPDARGLIRKIERNPGLVTAQVIRWKSGRDLLALVKKALL